MASQGQSPSTPIRKDHNSASRNPPGTLPSTRHPSHVEIESSTPRQAAAAFGSRNGHYRNPMSLRSPEDARGKFIPDRQKEPQQLQRNGNEPSSPIPRARKSAPSNIPVSTLSSEALLLGPTADTESQGCNHPVIHVTTKSVPYSLDYARLLQAFVAVYDPLTVFFDEKGFYIPFPTSEQGRTNLMKCYVEMKDTMLVGRYHLEMTIDFPPDNGLGLAKAPMRKPTWLNEHRDKPGTANTARGGTAPSTPVTKLTQNQNRHQTASATSPSNEATTNTSMPARRESSHSLSRSSPAQSMARIDRDETASSVSGRTSSEFSATKRPKCHRCREYGSEFEPLVSCSTCKRRYHRRCHKDAPVMSKVDADHTWQCDHCTKQPGQGQRLSKQPTPSIAGSPRKRPHSNHDQQSAKVSSNTTASCGAAQEVLCDEPALKRPKHDDSATKAAHIFTKPAASAHAKVIGKAGSKLTATADLATPGLATPGMRTGHRHTDDMSTTDLATARFSKSPSVQDHQLEEAQRLVEDSFVAMENRPESATQKRKLKLERRKIPPPGGHVPQSPNSLPKSSHEAVEKPSSSAFEVAKASEHVDVAHKPNRPPPQQVSMTAQHLVRDGRVPMVTQDSSALAEVGGAKIPASAPESNAMSATPMRVKPKLKAKRTWVEPKLIPCPSCQRIVEVFPDMTSSLCKHCRKKPEQKTSRIEGDRLVANNEVRPKRSIGAQAHHEKPRSQVDETQVDCSKANSLQNHQQSAVRSTHVPETIAGVARRELEEELAKERIAVKLKQEAELILRQKAELDVLEKDINTALTERDEKIATLEDDLVEKENEITKLKQHLKEAQSRHAREPQQTRQPQDSLEESESQIPGSRPEQHAPNNSTKLACWSCRKSHRRCKHTIEQIHDSYTAENIAQEESESKPDAVAGTEPSPRVDAASPSSAQDKVNFGDWEKRPKGTYEKLIEMAFSDHNGAKLRLADITKWVTETFSLYRGKEKSGLWVSGIGATLTMHTVGKSKGKNLWTKEEAWVNSKSKKGHGGLLKELWWMPAPKAYPRFHHFDRASRLAVVGDPMTGDRRSSGSSSTLQQENAGAAEAESADSGAPVDKPILEPPTRTSRRKNKGIKTAVDDTGVGGTDRGNPTRGEEAEASDAGSGKHARSERPALSLQGSRVNEDRMDVDARSQASAEFIGSSTATSRETSPESDAGPHPSAPQNTVPRDRGPYDTAPQNTTPQDAAPQDVSSDESNDEPYLRYSNRRSVRSATQQQKQPVSHSSTAAQSPVPPADDHKRIDGSGNEMWNVDDLYTTAYPELNPQWLVPVFDREAKMLEIRARPTRKQIFGKPIHMSRLKDGEFASLKQTSV